MSVAPAVTETTYLLSGAVLTGYYTIWPYADAADVTAWLDNADGNGPQPLVNPADFTVAASSPLVNGGQVTLSASLLTAGSWPTGARLSLARLTANGQPSVFGEDLGFSPAAAEASDDNIERQVQEVRTRATRALSVPLGEGARTVPDAAFRRAQVAYWTDTDTADLTYITDAALAAKLLKGDPGGNALSIGLWTGFGALSIPIGTDLVQSSGYGVAGKGAAKYVLDADQATVTSSGIRKKSANGRWFILAELEACPEHLGALMNGGDDYAALFAWGAIGDRYPLGLSRAVYSVASASLAVLAISLPAGTAIKGAGRKCSKIQVTGVASCNLFVAADVSSISIEDVWLYGNGVANASGIGAAFSYEQTTGAAAANSGFLIARNCFENFGADYWIRFVNNCTGHILSDIEICENVAYSHAGNARDGTNIGVPSIVFSIAGSIVAVTQVTDVRVNRNWADCTYIKTMAVFWSGILRGEMIGNTAYNVGADASVHDDKGAYAFFVYDAEGANPSDLISLLDNNVYGVRSCGIYTAGVKRIRIRPGVMMGQTDVNNGTLPKGLIAANGWQDVLIEKGGQLRDAIVGIAVSTPDGAARSFRVEGVDMPAGVTLGLDMHVSGVVGELAIDDFNYKNLSANSIGIQIQADATNNVDQLEINGHDIWATYQSILVFLPGTTPTFTKWTISHGKFRGRGINFNGLTSTTSPLYVHNNDFAGKWEANCRTLSVVGSLAAHLKDNTFQYDANLLYCMSTAGARGSIEGTKTRAVPQANVVENTGGATMGYDAPAWGGERGTYIENLAVAAAGGATGTRYQMLGWKWDPTATDGGPKFRENRMPTQTNTAVA